MTHSEQEEGDEEEDENAGYLDNLYGSQMVSIPSLDLRAFGRNFKATSISTYDVRVNSRERRRLRVPKALADCDLS